MSTQPQSPIEHALLRALLERCRADGIRMTLHRTNGTHRVGPSSAPTLEVWPQYQPRVLPYRFDFLLRAYDSSGADLETMVLECDGHEYHERTRQQAARDRTRDRATQIWGALVFRFTGSQIHADAGGCAREVIETLFQSTLALDQVAP